MAQQVYGISKIKIPSDFSDTFHLVQQSFPSIEVEEYYESDRTATKLNIIGNKNLEIPLNTLVQYSKRTKKLTIDTIIYPWDFLSIL